MLKYALLGILLRAPMTGYDLERWIRQTIDYFWPAQLSQIYRSLRQLEDEGLAVSEVEPQEGRPDRRVYTATAAGQAAFQAWLGELVTERDPVRVPFLVRFFFSGQRDARDVLTQLRVIRDLYTQHAQAFTTDIPATIETAKTMFRTSELDGIIWEATRRAGQLHTESWIHWLDETIATLEQQARPAEPGPQSGTT